jgi:hypothetical protein
MTAVFAGERLSAASDRARVVTVGWTPFPDEPTPAVHVGMGTVVQARYVWRRGRACSGCAAAWPGGRGPRVRQRARGGMEGCHEPRAARARPCRGAETLWV